MIAHHAVSCRYFKRLQAFHVRCLRQRLNITWPDHITSEAINPHRLQLFFFVFSNVSCFNSGIVCKAKLASVASFLVHIKSLHIIIIINLNRIDANRRASLFGQHVVRLNQDVRAHQALQMQTDLSTDRKSDVRWRRTPCRPRKTWCLQTGTTSECPTIGTPLSAVTSG